MRLWALLFGRRRPPPTETEAPMEVSEPEIAPPTERDRAAYQQMAENRAVASEGKRVAAEAMRQVGRPLTREAALLNLWGPDRAEGINGG